MTKGYACQVVLRNFLMLKINEMKNSKNYFTIKC